MNRPRVPSRAAWWPLLLCAGLLGCRAPAPGASPARRLQGPLRVLIDTDSANEIDDLLAVARAVREPRFQVVGITAAQWVTQPEAPPDTAARSHRLNQELMAALGRTEIPLAVGSDQPLPDVHTPRDSPAARLIIEAARATPEGQHLHVLTLGAVTNLASALLLAPDVAARIAAWTIMLRHETGPDGAPATWQRDEFNANNDQPGVDVLFATPQLDLVVMTATASQPLVFARDTVDRELGSDPGFGAFLTAYWDDYVRRMTWTSRTWNERRAWHMWDVALVEALADPRLATLTTVPAPPALDGSGGGRPVGLFTAIDAEAMEASFWRAVAPARAEPVTAPRAP